MNDLSNLKSVKNNAERKPLKWTLFLPFAFGLALVAGTQLGIYISSADGSVKTSHSSDKMHEIITLLGSKYVDTVNIQNLETEAINAWLGQLDPHTVYIPKEEMVAMNEDMQGNFEGIGIEFHIAQDTLLVVTPISGGPSEAAGLQAGDKIIKINDTIVAGIGIKNEDVMKKLRGNSGSKVKLSIQRSNEKKLLDFTIKRDKIPLYSVDVSIMLNENTGYIKVNRFSATTTDEVGQGLYDLNKKGMKSLILDLRQNPGGYLNAAVDICDEFLDGKKMVVYTKGNASPKQSYTASRQGQFENGKIVILIDEGSASASEIVAGAIQDHDRGTIIGKKSFGKGLVQDQFTLSDGSSLRLTVARYYTPSGRCIQRPYDLGANQYYNELLERRDLGGVLDTVHPNKDTAAYYTAKGRKVFAGGGIEPDILILDDTTLQWSMINRARRAIPEFVYENFPAGNSIFQPFKTPVEFATQFKVSPELLQKLSAFSLKRYNESLTFDKPRETAYIETMLKAFISKQKWKNDGYYSSLLPLDPFIQKALIELNQKNVSLNQKSLAK